MSARRLTAAVLAVLALCAGAFFWRSTRPAAPAFRFDYPQGRRFTYRLDYRAHSELHPNAGGDSKVLAGTVELAGDLVLHGRGRHGEVEQVGLSLEKLTRHAVVLFDHDALADDAAAQAGLTGHEALLELADDGTVKGVSFAPSDPSMFKNLVQTLVGELQVTTREGEQWTVDEPTPRGVAEVVYTVRDGADTQLSLWKHRLRYRSFIGLGDMGARPSLTSSFEIVLRRAGQLETLSAHELLAGGSSAAFDLTLRLVDERADAQAVLAQSQHVAPAALVPEPNAGHTFIDQQVDGLDEPKLLANIRLYASGGIIPGHNHFLIQATALLNQQPALCPKLAELFKDPQATLAGRAFVLDLLANAGSPAAQAAMRDALGSPQGQHDRAYNILFSRFSLVHTPTAETVRFIDETYRAAQPEHRETTAYALGSTAGALDRDGAHDEAAPALARLVGDLKASRAPHEQADLLLSLGNAGVAAEVATVLQYQSSDSADVRAAVAQALRKTQTPEAEAALLSLAADPEPGVQHEALQVLPRFSLDEAARRELRDQVIAGAISMKSYNDLVTLLTPYVQQDEVVREIFHFMLTHEVVDREVHTRIQTLLGPT